MGRKIRTKVRVNDTEMRILYEVSASEDAGVSALMREAVFDRDMDSRIMVDDSDTHSLEDKRLLLAKTIAEIDHEVTLNAPPLADDTLDVQVKKTEKKINDFIDRVKNAREKEKAEMVKIIEARIAEPVLDVIPEEDYEVRGNAIAVFVNPQELSELRKMADRQSTSISTYVKDITIRYFGYSPLIAFIYREEAEEADKALDEKINELRTILYDMKVSKLPERKQIADAKKCLVGIAKTFAKAQTAVKLNKAKIKEAAAETVEKAVLR